MVQPCSFSMKTVSHPSGTSHWKGENIYTFLQAHQSGQFEDSSILQPYLLTLEGEHVCVCVCVCELLGCVQLFAPHGLKAARFLCLWDSPGKNTGVGCRFLLQGIFLTQESYCVLLHCKRTC